MSLNRTQILILFTLFCTCAVLLFVVFTFNPTGPNRENIERGDNTATLVNTLQEGFEETVARTETEAEINALNDLTFAEKLTLVPDPAERIAFDVENPRYVPLEVEGFARVEASLDEVGRFQPEARDLYLEYVANRFPDGSEIYTIPADETEFRDLDPVLQRSTTFAPQIYTYLMQEDVHVFLGADLPHVFSFEVDGQEYWLSFALETSGRTGLLVSLPYFENLTRVPDVYFYSRDEEVVAGDLYLTLFEEGGLSGPQERRVRLSLLELLNVPPEADYNALFEDI